MGNDKLVLHVGGQIRVSARVYTYKSYFMFYRKVNGTWQYQYAMEAPGNGTNYYSGRFISLNANTLFIIVIEMVFMLFSIKEAE